MRPGFVIIRKVARENASQVGQLYELNPALFAPVYPRGESGLAGMVTVLLALACIVVTFRELLPAKVSRE